MSQFNNQIQPGQRQDPWKIGIDRRRVTTYIGLALIAGFALGYAAANYIGAAKTAAQARDRRLANPSTASEPASAKAAEALTTPDAFHKVTRIIRADAIEVEGVGAVRMLGIETPDGKSPQQIYAPYTRTALAFTESSLLAKEVRLEFDPTSSAQTNKDDQGQAIAYVFTKDGQLFNGEMIRQGQAFLRTDPPFRRIDEFRALEREAMQAMRGVWGPSGGQAGDASVARNDPTRSDIKAGGTQDRAKRPMPLAPSDLDLKTPGPSATSSESLVYVSPSDRLYHKEGCEYLSKKKQQPLQISRAKSEGYAPCGRCFASTVLKAQ
jgi:endonuclease YncB( thermonuclease family)